MMCMYMSCMSHVDILVNVVALLLVVSHMCDTYNITLQKLRGLDVSRRWGEMLRYFRFSDLLQST